MSESKLIRVEDLEKIYQNRIDMLVKDEDPFSEALAGAVSGCLRIAKELVPAVDAVEVIRCRDCKYYHPRRETFGVCRQGDDWREVYLSDFCSCGERKGQE